MQERQGINEDYAIVVGIQHYPGLGSGRFEEDLKGAVNDARAFYDWLIMDRPSGAGLPTCNVKLILQAIPVPGEILERGQPVRPSEIIFSRPNLYDITAAFQELDLIALRHRTQPDIVREKVGRRLYLYMAGHGIEPGLGMPGITAGPALLLANATNRDFKQHLLGKQYASWYVTAGYFDEVLLFMDCCRDNTFVTPARPLDRDFFFGAVPAQYFYAFGTKWDRRTREVNVNGKTRGIFTLAILEGLLGAAGDPITHEVTTGSLRDFVPQIMDELVAMTPIGRLTQFPEFEPCESKEMVVCAPPPKLYHVTIPLPPDAIGKNFQIRIITDPTSKQVHKEKPMAASLRVDLPRGIYTGQFTNNGNTIMTAAITVPQKSPSDIQFLEQ